jgi:hypothetical protein
MSKSYYVTVDILYTDGYTIKAKNKKEASDKAIDKAWDDYPDCGEVTVHEIEVENE